MHWMGLAVVGYLMLLTQTTLGIIFAVSLPSLGKVSPDLLAILATFVAMHVRARPDALLAAWVLGFCVDLLAGGATGAAVGPMAIGYVLAAWVIYSLREAFFRHRATTQALLAALFCLVAHWLWVTFQSLLASKDMTWGDYGRMMAQAAGLAAYTALLMPLVHFCLAKCQRWLIAAPAGRGRGR